MTSAAAIEKFSFLLDTRSSPNFDNDEVLAFLNMAQNEFLARMFPDSLGQGVVNFEVDQNVLDNLRNLIFTFTTGMDSTGNVLFNDLDESLITLSGDDDASVLKIISVAVSTAGVKKPAKFSRHNDLWSQNANYFKAPSTSNFRYTIEKNTTEGVSLQFYPISQSVILVFTVVKKPKIMTIDNSPDFSDYAMNQIIPMALQYAGVGVRDGEMTSLIQNSNISK